MNRIVRLLVLLLAMACLALVLGSVMQGCAMTVDDDESVELDVAADDEALTLVGSYTFINSEGGAQIFRSNGAYDAVRCFVMSKGSTSNPNYWTVTLTGSTAYAKHTGVAGGWKAEHTGSGSNIKKCTTDTTCSTVGFVSYTANNNVVFDGNSVDGFARQLCTYEAGSGGTFGHPILKRYGP